VVEDPPSGSSVGSVDRRAGAIQEGTLRQYPVRNAVGLALLLLILSMSCALSMSYALQREFPTDGAMIADFQAHRGDFERLVALYQEHGPHGRLRKEKPEYSEYITLLKQRGLSDLSGDGAIWLPDPYSADTAKKRPRGAASFAAFAHHG
jgi:hypothetical protein